MSRFGRRTFLASSAGVAGAAAAGAPPPLGSTLGSGAATRPVGVVDVAGSSGGPIRALGLTVNGLTDPVGIDPDGCFFAWTLQSPGRAVAQAAFRVVVRRTDPTRTRVVWDSGPVASARQAFVAYGGPGLAADAAYQWTVQVRGPAEWGPVAAPAQFTTALRDTDWQAKWLRPAGESSQPDRVTYLRSEVTPPAGAVARATAFVSAAHTYRLFVDGTPVDAWPSFSYPDEQYVLGARPALPALGLVPGRTPGRVRIGRHLA
jgi:alpha-L-rhamnosidase